MEGLRRLTAFALVMTLALLAACGPEAKVAPVPTPTPPVPAPTTDRLFPSPYFPAQDLEIAGRPVAEIGQGWREAGIYTETRLDARQKAWVATLEPAGGEGLVGPGFQGDFDGDGKMESVVYGAYRKDSGEGNFVLVTRDAAEEPEVLLLKEFPGTPAFTVFTLKSDGSLWFGGGIDAGEVTMRIAWTGTTPEFSFLTEE